MPATLSPPDAPVPAPSDEAVIPHEDPPMDSPLPYTEAAALPPGARPDTMWVWQVTALSVVLGVMLALAISTTQRIRKLGLTGPRLGASAAILSAFEGKNQSLQSEIRDLRSKLREFEQSVDSESRARGVLKEELQELKTLSGLAPVQGAGIKVLLRDSPVTRLPDLTLEDQENYLVHDQDINGVISELKAAGAEALAISGADPKNMQRVVVTTTARCVGPVAIVNGAKLSAPYTIYAIGNPKELHGALEMPNGYMEVRGLKLLKMYTIEEAENLVLPEYSGSFSPKYARSAPSRE